MQNKSVETFSLVYAFVCVAVQFSNSTRKATELQNKNVSEMIKCQKISVMAHPHMTGVSVPIFLTLSAKQVS